MRIASAAWLLALAVSVASSNKLCASSGPGLRIGLVGRFGSPAALTLAAPAGTRFHAGAYDRRAPKKTDLIRVQADSGKVKVEDAEGKLLAKSETLVVEPADAGEPLGVAPPHVPSSSANRSQLSSRGRTARAAARHQDPPARYRGWLEISAKPEGGLRVVNIIPVEEYVRGVVALEIGADAPEEALKAQAVAARTYALKSRGRFAKQGYDLTDTTASQAYGGVGAETDATDRAVRDTHGLVLMRSGRLVLTDYYDDCGGVTAPGEDESDFPPSVVDSAEGGADYCAGGRSHTWKLALFLDEADRIARSIARWPAGEKVANIEVQETDTSGRANTVRLTDVDGNAREIRGTALRALVGYSRLKSTLFKVTRTETGFLFEGRGYGHGRGMCQAGAIGMASPPYRRSFREILTHYFPGTTVETWSDSDERAEKGRASGR